MRRDLELIDIGLELPKCLIRGHCELCQLVYLFSNIQSNAEILYHTSQAGHR